MQSPPWPAITTERSSPQTYPSVTVTHCQLPPWGLPAQRQVAACTCACGFGLAQLSRALPCTRAGRFPDQRCALMRHCRRGIYRRQHRGHRQQRLCRRRCLPRSRQHLRCRGDLPLGAKASASYAASSWTSRHGHAVARLEHVRCRGGCPAVNILDDAQGGNGNLTLSSGWWLPQVITRREGKSLGFVEQLYVLPQQLAVVNINLKNDRLPLTPPTRNIPICRAAADRRRAAGPG